METDRESQQEIDGSTHLLEQEEEDKSNHLPSESFKMVKQNGDHDDGAGEKLVPEDGKINSNKEASEVKFISADSQNGDAKIDIENVKLAFAGMGKEELMKFANDPFWIRMRWFLFIFFWLLWLGMLAGAVAIIVMAPKCAAPAPLKWWEQTALYQVDIRSFKDGGNPQDGVGDIKGLQSKLEYIKGLGVKGVIISSVLKSSDTTTDDTVENFQDIDPLFGTLEDFRNLTAAMKSKELHLVMNFVPNHSSNKHPWFLKSEEMEDPYTDYYIWAKDNGEEDGGKKIPPNNWKSLFGGSAWEWSEKRKEFYLHQFRKNQPDLNFRSEGVIKAFRDILTFWLDNGVSGFEFDKVQYLLEDEKLTDEAIGTKVGFMHDQYEFYSHIHTSNLPGIVDVLAEWKQVFHNRTDLDGMFSITSNATRNVPFDYHGNSSNVVVDVLRHTDLLTSLGGDFTANQLNHVIQKWLTFVPSDTRAYWELGNRNSSRVATRLSPDVVDGLNMVTMLLPGTPITYYGEELGMEDADANSAFPSRAPMQWSNTTNAGFSEAESAWMPLGANYEEANVEAESEAKESHLKVYQALVKARDSPSIMYGMYEYTVYNGTVFAYTRIKSGNPGYLVAFNPSDSDVTVNFKDLKNMSDELTVLIRSTNFKDIDKVKLQTDAVPLSAKGALVLTFVPKQ